MKPSFIYLAEQGLLPDAVIRAGMRRVIKSRLCLDADPEERTRQFQTWRAELNDSPIAICTEDANKQHYEVPADFFKIHLGPRRKYSCCLFKAEETSLLQAEQAMLDLYCQRAGLFDGMKILDLGCGWGSLSLYLAEKFPNSKIVGLSNSDSQRVFITEQANLLGLRNLTIVTGNIVDYEFSNEVFDRVLSVEMFEHMRNYRLLLAKIARWLKPSGSLFVHIFAHPTLSYPYEVKDSSDWMTEHFFSGGIMPSEHLLAYFQDDLKISQQWWLNGKHYQKTAEHWLLNMDANAAQIDQIFKQSYGDSFRTWRQRWRMFYMAVSELFGYDNGNQWGVTHILMKKDPRPTAERQGDGRAGG